MEPRRLVTSFAKDNPTVDALQFIRDDPEGVQVSLIADGYINYVFRVQACQGTESVIIKHSESYFKGAPEVMLSLRRQQLEYDCMLLMDSIQRGSVPTPYCLDTTHNIIAMRDLTGCDWELLFHQVFFKKDINLGAAAHLGQTLSTLHTLTSRNNATPQQWQQLQAKFKHDDLKEPLLDLHHREQYDIHDPTSFITDEFTDSYRNMVNDIKQQGLDLKVVETFQDEVCVIHADLHHRNIFVRDGKTTLIDFEFGFLGHPAVNLGLPIQGYVFTYIVGEAEQARGQTSTRTGHSLTAQCKQAIRTMMETYLEYRTDLGNDADELREFFSALTLLTGSFLFFVGARGFSTMSGVRGMCSSDRGPLMTHGHKLMMNHQGVTSLDDLMQLL